MPVVPIVLTTPQLREALTRLTGEDVPQTTLSYWSKTGLLTPSHTYTGRRGGLILYTARDLFLARVIVALRADGCPLQRIRAFVTYQGDQLRSPNAVRRSLRYDRIRGVIVFAGPRGREQDEHGQVFFRLSDLWEGVEQAAEQATARA